jgi:hypothetical protein
MSSRGKKKTTMAKLSRESRLRERRLDKAARKDARKNAPAVDDPMTELSDELSHDSEDEAGPLATFAPISETAAQPRQ